MPPHLVTVLLVEDNAGDVRLTVEAFKDAGVPLELHVVNDGEQALDFLYRRGNYALSPRPELILLDLNLPRKDGREVLAEIKLDPHLKSIPVVILSTSTSRAEIEQSYQLQANCYVAKPVELEGFLAVVRGIDDFWLSTAKLPQEGLQ